MEHLIRNEVGRFVQENPANLSLDGGSYFDAPLVAFAAADDPLFGRYKEIIGTFHLTPQELMTGAFGAESRAATVISWSLPVARPIRESNRKERQWPSREWAEQRHHGEGLNTLLRRHLVAWLGGKGWQALAPQLSPSWRQLDSPAGIASTWSERHAAFAAGLGTFSINDALITPRGIAHRLGSVITALPLPPSPRPYEDYREYCLFCRNGSCGACIRRCPAGALSVAGHDKEKCRAYVYEEAPRAVAERYGVTAVGCGLCQTAVPCEAAIPPTKDAGPR